MDRQKMKFDEIAKLYMNNFFDIQNMKIGDKCFYMYHNEPTEGRIKDISFYGSTGDDNRKLKFNNNYRVTVQYVFEKDENRLGTDTIEVREIFPTKKALMNHLNSLMEKSMDNYKRYEDG